MVGFCLTGCFNLPNLQSEHVIASGKSKLLALCIAVAGILTFFTKSVSTDPAVANLTRWSPLDIVLQMYQGALPAPNCERCGEALIRTVLALPVWVTAEYFLLVAVVVGLCFRWHPRAILSLAVLAVYNSFALRRVGTELEFHWAFYRSSRQGGRVHYGELVAEHVIVAIALFLTSLEILEDSTAEPKRSSSVFVDDDGPPIIDAEIVPEADVSPQFERNSRRLRD
jgi:hypothetical protein